MIKVNNLVPRQMSAKLAKKRKAELNFKNFPSEKWAEAILFKEGLGGFRRNACLDSRYFGDFVWRTWKIVLEIDGKSHIGKEEYDRQRDAHLESLGYKVFRIMYLDLSSFNEVLPKLKELITVKPIVAGKPNKIKRKNVAKLNQELIRKAFLLTEMTKERLKLRNKIQGYIGYAKSLPRRLGNAFLEKKLKQLGLTAEEAKGLL